VSKNPNLKYPEYFKDFVNLHKISEFFGLNPDLEPRFKANSEELVFKIDDIQMCDKLIKVVDLQRAIAKTLKTKPSALQLVSIEEGCILVKFLISTALKGTLTELSPHQKEELRKLSILSLSCGDYELDLSDCESHHGHIIGEEGMLIHSMVRTD
jgi:hypothetical protein